ncbi:MAG: transcription elongation factor GreA [bacterium]
MPKENYITKDGLEQLKSELEYYKNERRMEVANRIREAKAQGDLSENAEYAEAKTEQEYVERRISELKEIIKRAKVIEDSDQPKDMAGLGSTVEIKDSEAIKSYTIVGSNEADPLNGRISNESPIGKALLGCRVKDEVVVTTPNGETIYKVLSIN